MIPAIKKAILFLTTVVFTCTGLAATIRVPADQPTIQDGIDAASNDDTVLLAGGTYSGEGNCNVDINGKSLLIRSESGAESCVIDCALQDPCFYVHSGTAASCEIQGLTICRCRSDQGAAILSENCELRIVSCIITGNRATTGAGICCLGDGSLAVSDSIISDNTAQIGAGVYCSGSISTAIDGSTITQNIGSGVFCTEGCPLSISNSTVSLNRGRGVTGFNGLGVEHCRITDNRDGGIDCSGIVHIVHSSIDNNTAESGAGIRCSQADVHIDSCSVSGNHGGDSSLAAGGALHCSRMTSVTMTNCLITSNRSRRGGALYAELFCYLGLTNCTLAANRADTYGGACYWFFSGVSLLNCIEWNNSPDGFCGYDLSASFSNIEGGCPGLGNIDEDPMFVGGYPFDYHLTPSSPCIDSATDDAAPGTDLESMARPLGGAHDMGAYEFPGYPSGTRTWVRMPAHLFHQGDIASCSVSVWNGGNDLPADTRLFVVLDTGYGLFCAPSFNSLDWYTLTFPESLTEISILPQFSWPGGCGNASGITWYAALLDPGMTRLLCPIGAFEFGWE